MQKEILTLKNIKKDLNKHFLHKIRDLLLSLFIIPIANIIILNVISLFWNLTDSLKITFSIIFYSIGFLLVSYDLITIITGLIQIKNTKFEITSDWVIEKKQKEYGSRISNPKPYRFIFANSGTYNIPYGKNYLWSDMFTTSDETLYEHTNINDDFYIISVGKQKNIISYNKNFFEYQN